MFETKEDAQGPEQPRRRRPNHSSYAWEGPARPSPNPPITTTERTDPVNPFSPKKAPGEAY